MTVALQGKLEARIGKEHSLALCKARVCLELSVHEQAALLPVIFENVTRAGEIQKVKAGPIEGEDGCI